jgi:hypothetical protein
MQMVRASVALATVLFWTPIPLLAQQTVPRLADIKAAAESGDPQAQDKLGDAYLAHSDFENAVTWYRRSAPAGIANSQYQLAGLLLVWAGSFTVPAGTRAAHTDEALPWLLKAAAQRHLHAELDLAQLYQDGKYLKQDLPEAYKWYSLAMEGKLSDVFVATGTSSRDALILKMSQAQLAEGNRRVSEFLANPAQPTPAPEPSFVASLKLQGITGTPGHPLAIINGKTLAPNDSVTLKLENRSIPIRCLSITSHSAIISVDGLAAPKELILR